jgi:hypothetical protein
MNIEPKNIRTLISSLKKKGYVIYDKPNQLNIVGVRNKTTIPNKFDDLIYVFWKNEKNEWVGKYFTSTTDPGTYYLKNPLSKLGTAILKQGQYVDSYAIGKHKGQYDALVQVKPVTVIRDYDRNAILDFLNGREEKGLFGINIHKAGKDSSDVNNWSAGCQVFQKSADFNNFMDLAEKHRKLYGNKFTYTLIDERAYNRAKLFNQATIMASLILVAATWVAIRTYQNKSITKFN